MGPTPSVWNDGNITASWITLHPVSHSPAFDIRPDSFQVHADGRLGAAERNPISVQRKGARFKSDGTSSPP
jgi:hypothetical protein